MTMIPYVLFISLYLQISNKTLLCTGVYTSSQNGRQANQNLALPQTCCITFGKSLSSSSLNSLSTPFILISVPLRIQIMDKKNILILYYKLGAYPHLQIPKSMTWLSGVCNILQWYLKLLTPTEIKHTNGFNYLMLVIHACKNGLNLIVSYFPHLWLG